MVLLCIICILIALCAISYAAYAKSKCIKLDTATEQQNAELKKKYEWYMNELSLLDTQYTDMGNTISALRVDNDKALVFSKQISEEIKSLSQQRESHLTEVNELLQEKQIIEVEIKNKQAQMLDLTQNIDALSSSSKATARASFEQYCDSLDAEYTLKEQEFDADLENLDKLYADQHDAILREMSENTARANEQKEQLNRDLDIIRRELEKIRATRAATMDAQLREQEIKDKATFYTIQLNEADRRDVAYLQSIEYNLREARPLRMLIWTTFYRDKVNDLAARVGAVGATGIYKITHIDSGISYVGQARDIKERWVTHIKCSLGIDTPVTSQLYAFTREKGIDNFTFEILEKCSASELNEKEKFYIDLYQTYEFGLNGNKGVGK